MFFVQYFARLLFHKENGTVLAACFAQIPDADKLGGSLKLLAIP
jgi:hypothetical protein